MTHQSGHIIISSLLDIFDPTNPSYNGVRVHFSDHELEKIDALRALPESHDFTTGEKLFVSYVITRAIFTGA